MIGRCEQLDPNPFRCRAVTRFLLFLVADQGGGQWILRQDFRGFCCTPCPCATLRRMEPPVRLPPGEPDSGPVVDPDPGIRPDPEPRASGARDRILIVAGGALLLVMLALWSARDYGPLSFKIYVTDSGVYRVTYEDLERAGLEADTVDSRDLALSHGGAQVPLWVADGGDGRFGPGDRIELVGEHLLGHRSYYHEYTLLNVYNLTVGESQGPRMSSPALPDTAVRAAEPAHMEVEKHLEENNFLVHFLGRSVEAPEPRFWVRMSHIDPEPFRYSLWLGRGRAGSRPLSLAVQLRGWSDAGRSQGGALADHRVELYFNGQLVGAGEWDSHESHLIEVPEVPAELVKPDAANFLELKIPRRRPSASADPLVDVALLNWIEVRHPHPEADSVLGGSWIPSEPQRLVLAPPSAVGRRSPARVRLATDPGARLLVYGAEGSRFDSRNMEVEDGEKAAVHHFYPPPEESVFHVVRAGVLKPPAAVELDRPSSLKDRSRQADYVIIAHPRLLRAIEPLAAFHRRRGLEVAVVAVDDVYDEFNHSILDPAAIRDFLSYAYHEWRRPAPRFVLLVGDASWDAEGSSSRYHGGAPYASEVALSHRNLIPTWSYEGDQGRAASDNFFASVDGGDHLPDLAIGRFPVAEPAAVTAIVDKILRYAEEVGVGPWRRKILWLSDVSSFMQERSDGIAGAVAARGFASLKLYPAKDASSTERTHDPLLQAFDRGQLLVHFLGHGARYVWRTGPNRDRRNNYDLFTLKHLHELKPTAKLPLVLSMTCWSAPFDHPTADSIGENFLSLEGRGAVAFLGASWKVSPNKIFSDLLLEELTSPGTIGEAIQQAKRRLGTRNLVENYNLLGDPALQLALPQHTLEIAVPGDGNVPEEGKGKDAWKIVVTVPEEGFAGSAVVDWLDAAGEVVRSEHLEVRDATLEAGFRRTGKEGAVASVRVYVWNEALGVDGIGALELRSDLG